MQQLRVSLGKPLEALHDTELRRHKFPFGSLVYWPQAKVTKKVELKTLPGLFWRTYPGSDSKRLTSAPIGASQRLFSGKVEVNPQTATTTYQDNELRYPLAEVRAKGQIELTPNVLTLDLEELPVGEVIEG